MTVTEKSIRQDLISERQRLSGQLARVDAALKALSGGTTTNGSESTKSSRGRGRPKGTGKRAEEVVKLVSDSKDGLTVAQIAEQMGIRPNYLYRVLPALEREGKIVKDGQRYRAA